MAARAIVGILLGIIFAPVLWLVLIIYPAMLSVSSIIGFPEFISLVPESIPVDFSTWLLSITSDFTGAFLTGYINAGMLSLNAPLIDIFVGPTVTISNWIPLFGAACITWIVVGIWAGAIERSPGRGIGVGIGVWLGWLIIEIIWLAINGLIGLIGLLLYWQWFTAVLVIATAAIFGAITKSEEF